MGVEGRDVKGIFRNSAKPRKEALVRATIYLTDIFMPS